MPGLSVTDTNSVIEIEWSASNTSYYYSIVPVLSIHGSKLGGE